MKIKLISTIFFMISITFLTDVIIIPSAAKAEEAQIGEKIISSEFFINKSSVQLGGNAQYNEGALILIPSSRMFIFRRTGDVFEVNSRNMEVNQLGIVIPYSEFSQRSIGERGLTGVKGVAYWPEQTSIAVYTVQSRNNCAYPEIFLVKVQNNDFGKVNSFWKPKVCVPVPELPDDFPNITASSRNNQPNVSQAGGRMLALNNKLLVTVGNFGDSWRSSAQVLSDSKNNRWPFGKIIQIDIKKNVSVVSTGHRNQQGLSVTSLGLLESEHGPEGGDEINIIRNGKNYGWPWFSLGHQYSFENGNYRNVGEPYGSGHGNQNFEAPLYSWNPSVAPSQLIQLPSAEYWGNWRFNILMGTLKDQSIRRIEIYQGRVVTDERISVGFRVRDLALVGSNLFALSDDSKLYKLEFSHRKINS